MAADTDDQKNLSPDAVERCVAQIAGHYDLLTLTSHPEQTPEEVVVIVTKELRQFFRELGATAPIGSDLMTLCMTVCSGLTTQVLEPYEERKADARASAKWRPIEEAPRDGTKICVWWAAGKGPIRDYPERMEFLWWERDCWISDLGGRALTHSGCVDVGAMFRTIDPPSNP